MVDPEQGPPVDGMALEREGGVPLVDGAAPAKVSNLEHAAVQVQKQVC